MKAPVPPRIEQYAGNQQSDFSPNKERLPHQEWTWLYGLISPRVIWITDGNEPDLPSVLRSNPPRQFEREYYSRHSSPFVAA